MRTARIVEEGAAYYHITSRVVDRRYVFDDAEKERVRKTVSEIGLYDSTGRMKEARKSPTRPEPS